MMIDVDNLSDGLSIAAITSELHAEDRALDSPKIEFTANIILAGRFIDNPHDDIRDYNEYVPQWVSSHWVKIHWR